MLKTAYELGIRKAYEEAGLLDSAGALEKTAAAQLPAVRMPSSGVDPLSAFYNVKTSGEQSREFALGKFATKHVPLDLDSVMRNAFKGTRLTLN